MKRPRFAVDAIGHIRDLQSHDLLLRLNLRFEDRDHRVVLGGGPGDLRDVLLERFPLDEQGLVISEDGERVAGRHMLATLDLQFLDQQGNLGARARFRSGCPRRPYDDRTKQRAIRDNLLDLRLREPVEQQRLPLYGADRLEFLKLIPPLEDRFDRDDSLWSDPFQTGDLPADDVQLLGRFEQGRLSLHEFLVGQSHLEERLVGSDRLAFRHMNLRDESGHGSDDRELRPSAALHHDARHADRAVERRQGDVALPQADAAAGLLAQFERVFLAVSLVGVFVVVIVLAAVFMVTGMRRVPRQRDGRVASGGNAAQHADRAFAKRLGPLPIGGSPDRSGGDEQQRHQREEPSDGVGWGSGGRYGHGRAYACGGHRARRDAGMRPAARAPTRVRDGRNGEIARPDRPRRASDQKTLEESMPTSARIDRLDNRTPFAGVGKQHDGLAVERRHNAGCQRRPRNRHPGFGRGCHAVTTLTPVTAQAVVGDHDHGMAILDAANCGADVFDTAAHRVLALAGHIIVVVVVAAGIPCRRLNGVRHGLTTSAKVARVQATAEGEMNHRRDGRDDADE